MGSKRIKRGRPRTSIDDSPTVWRGSLRREGGSLFGRGYPWRKLRDRLLELAYNHWSPGDASVFEAFLFEYNKKRLQDTRKALGFSSVRAMRRRAVDLQSAMCEWIKDDAIYQHWSEVYEQTNGTEPLWAGEKDEFRRRDKRYKQWSIRDVLGQTSEHRKHASFKTRQKEDARWGSYPAASCVTSLIG